MTILVERIQSVRTSIWELIFINVEDPELPQLFT